MVEIETLDTVSKFVSGIARRWRGSRDLIGLIDDELWEIEPELSEAGASARKAFQEIPVLIQRDVGDLPLFELAEVAQAVTYLYSQQRDKRVPQDVRYVFAGLATRSISTLREIAILVESGYAFGAKSRWRTLSEILVVARVLTEGNRYTASRYKEHRWVMMARQREITKDFEWGSDLPTPEVMVKRLSRRFGNAYVEGPYGWASRVVSQRLGWSKRVQWHHLEHVAEMNSHKPRVQDAHHAVHADALGLLGTVSASVGLFHAGASPQGVLEVARDSVRLFREVMWALFDNCAKYSGERKILIFQGMVEAHAFNLEQILTHRVISIDPRIGG